MKIFAPNSYFSTVPFLSIVNGEDDLMILLYGCKTYTKITKLGRFPNELSHAKATGWRSCGNDEDGLATCLSTGPVAVSMRTRGRRSVRSV